MFGGDGTGGKIKYKQIQVSKWILNMDCGDYDMHYA